MVSVGEQGQAQFARMVEQNAWGAFDVLPADSTLLRAISIVRVTGSSPGATRPRAVAIIPRVTLEVVTLKDRQMIRDADLPLQLEGTYSAVEPVHVWVVLQDIYGHLYLQNPEVLFLPNGRWVASNVLPGMDITFVHFVAVDEPGQAYFRQMVERHAWGAFDSLPVDSMLLHTIRITRVRGAVC